MRTHEDIVFRMLTSACHSVIRAVELGQLVATETAGSGPVIRLRDTLAQVDSMLATDPKPFKEERRDGDDDHQSNPRG